MKTKYLTRSVTINKESLSDLVARTGVEFGSRGDLECVLGSIGAGGALHKHLPDELFPNGEEGAKTFTGEEFAIRSPVALRAVNEQFRKVGDDYCESHKDAKHTNTAVSRLLGFATAILLAVEDALFGSEADDVEEEKADE